MTRAKAVWSAESTGTPVPSVTAPGDVGTVRASAGNRTISLSWSAVADNGATVTYDIWWKRSSESWSSNPNRSQTGRSHTITGLTNNALYNVRVRARNSAGSSAYSFVNATPRAGRPNAPQLSGSFRPGSVALSWTSPSNNGSAVISYRLQWRNVTDSENWNSTRQVTIGSSHASFNGRSHTVTGLTNGDSYQFRIYATNSSGEGSASNILSVTPVDNSPVIFNTAGAHTHTWISAYAKCEIKLIGAGGGGGGGGESDRTNASRGGDGGDTAVTVDGSTYTATGGDGGRWRLASCQRSYQSSRWRQR